MTSPLGPDICEKLRTKTMYLNTDYRASADEPGGRGTAAFWCLKTHRPLGPDDLPACPEDCHAGRACAVVQSPRA